MSVIPWRNKQREAGPQESSPLAALRTEIDRLFNAYIRDPLASVDWPFATPSGWAPAVDVTEDENHVDVRAEVPGIEPADLDVTVTSGQLILSGEKREAAERAGKTVHVGECRYGAFRRVISLPGAVDAEQAEAQCANGVLTVHIKKVQTLQPKRVPVRIQQEAPPPSEG